MIVIMELDLNSIVMGVCFAFMAAFLLLYIWFYGYPIWKKIQKVKEFNALLSDYSNENINYNYEALNESLNNRGVLSTIWEVYSKSLVVTTATTGYKKVYSTDSSSNYFNFTNLTLDLNTKFWQNLAGVFTGLGILGTFAGLTVGLSKINLNPEKVHELAEGIAVLLGGMRTAFYTSLVGIFLAIIFGIFHGKLVHTLENELRDVSQQLDSIFTLKVIEQWLADNNAEAQQQTEALKTFSTEVAIKLGSALDGSLERNLKPVLVELLSAVNTLNTSGVNAVSSAISEGTGTELKEFARTLGDLQRTLTDTMNQSKAANETINKSLLEAVQKLSNTLDESGKSINVNFTSATQKINSTLTEHETAMVATAAKLTDIMKSSKELVENAGETAKVFGEAATPMKEAAALMNNQIQQLTDANKRFTETISVTATKLNETANHNVKTIEDIKSGLQETKDAWKSYENNFKNLSGELEKTFTILSQSMRDYNDLTNNGLKEKLNLFDQNIASTLSRIATLNEEIGDDISDMANLLKKHVR